MIFFSGLVLGCFIIIMLNKAKYNIEISNIKVASNSIPLENIKVVSPIITRKKRNIFNVNNEIEIEGLGSFTLSQDIKVNKITTRNLYLRAGFDTIFYKEWDIIPYVGIQYNHKRLAYYLDFGYSPVTSNYKISLAIGFRIWGD